jgi:hypothetical protein
MSKVTATCCLFGVVCGVSGAVWVGGWVGGLVSNKQNKPKQPTNQTNEQTNEQTNKQTARRLSLPFWFITSRRRLSMASCRAASAASTFCSEGLMYT